MNSPTAPARPRTRRHPIASPRARGARIALAALGAMAGGGSARAAQPTYTIVTLGLTDANHTQTGGFQSTSASLLNDSGRVAGTSNRYAGSSFLGQDAWTYNPVSNTSVQIGLTDASNADVNGNRIQAPEYLNAGGFVAGYAYRYTGTTNIGQDSWLYSPTTGLSTELGYTDAQHTLVGGTFSGSQTHALQGLNDAGQIIGYSQRYSAATDTGRDAWFYATPTAAPALIGLTDAAHTLTSAGADNGTRFHNALRINAAGQASGFSKRYSGVNEIGQDAWLYTPGGTSVKIGLADAAHTLTSAGAPTNGTQFHHPQYQNATGQVAGYSHRYSAANYIGQDVWLYTPGGSSVKIGLVDAAHTLTTGGTDNGTQNHAVQALNDAGRVAGQSQRYSGATDLGQDAWLTAAGGGTPVMIGLIDTAHAQGNVLTGYRYHGADLINASARVAGFSSRYSGVNEVGLDAWVYNPSTNTSSKIGLADAQHTLTSPDATINGTQFHLNDFINAAGQVAGVSFRYNGENPIGQDAWVYDPTLGQTISLAGTVPANAAADSAVGYLGDNGVALGSFTKFSGATSLGLYAFRWTATQGFSELGLLVSGGLAASGWQTLNDATNNANGRVLAAGTRTSAGAPKLAALLVPTKYVWGGVTGAWSDPMKWDVAAVPSAVNDVTLPAGTYTATLTAAAAAKSISAVNGGAATLALAGNTLALAANLGVGTLGVPAEVLTVSGGTFSVAGTTTVAGTSELRLGGAVTLAAVAGAGKTSATGTGTVVTTGNFTQGSADVAAGAELRVGTGTVGAVTGAGTFAVVPAAALVATAAPQVGTLQVNGTLTVNAGVGTTVVGALTMAGGIAPTGKLDLKNNSLVVTYGTNSSPRGTLEQQVIAGLGGTAGIVTSLRTPGALTLGIADTADLAGITTNNGATAPPNSVVVRYTYAGDVDLDGSVDTADLGVMLDNFGALADPGGRQWLIGDVNYDASVDTADLGLALDNFGRLAGSAAAQAAMAGFGFTLENSVETGTANGRQVRLELTGAALPEPASLGLAGACAMSILSRRRRTL